MPPMRWRTTEQSAPVATPGARPPSSVTKACSWLARGPSRPWLLLSRHRKATASNECSNSSPPRTTNSVDCCVCDCWGEVRDTYRPTTTQNKPPIHNTLPLAAEPLQTRTSL
eukprot:5062433-Prymnesium_polylepis.3